MTSLLAIEELFYTAGLGAAGAGVLSIVLSLVIRRRGLFKAGTVAWFLGDGCFAVAIAFPRRALALAGSLNLTAAVEAWATLWGAIVVLMIILLSAALFIRRAPAPRAEAEGKDPEGASEEKAQTADTPARRATADPALFADLNAVKEKTSA